MESKLNTLKYFRDLKREYLAKSPRGKWEFIRDINIIPMNFIGTEYMEPNFRINWKTVIPPFIGLEYTLAMSYTLHYHKDNPLKAMQATPLLGIVIPVCFDV